MQLDVLAAGTRRAADGHVCGRTLGPLSGPGPGRRRRAAAGCLRAPATVDAADVFVFPLAPPQSTAIPRTELLDRLGTHLTRHVGPWRRVCRHPPVRARRPAAHGQLAGERAPRQPACHRAADRPRRRRGGADRHVPAAARARRRKRPNERCAAPFRWCRARCEAATGPASSRSAAVDPAGSAPTSGVGSSTACWTRCSGAGDEFETTHRHIGAARRRFRPARSSSPSRRCSTPSSRCR